MEDESNSYPFTTIILHGFATIAPGRSAEPVPPLDGAPPLPDDHRRVANPPGISLYFPRRGFEDEHGNHG